MITEYDFNLASGSNSWKRVGDTHPVDLYYGKDEKGRTILMVQNPSSFRYWTTNYCTRSAISSTP